MFGTDPVVAPALLALGLGVFAITAAISGEWVTAVLAYLDAVGMTAIAAHSRIERGGK